MEEKRENENIVNQMRIQRQSKADKQKIKKIENNVGEILDLLRRRRSELDDEELMRNTENEQNLNSETRDLPKSHYIVI